MWSARYAAPLRIELRRSRRLALVLASIHGGALIMLMCLPISAWLTVMIGAVVIATGARALVVHVLMNGERTVTALIWKRDGAWILLTRNGGQQACRLLPASYVHPQMTVLRFTGQLRRSVILLPDSLDAEAFRRLRVRLALEIA